MGNRSSSERGKGVRSSHAHHNVETREALRQGFFAGQVIAEEGDFTTRRQLRPVCQAFGDSLVIIKNGDFHQGFSQTFHKDR